MKPTRLLIFLIILSSFACKSKQEPKTVAADTSIAIDLLSTSSGDVYAVSMIKLLANPEKYNGKRVMLDGFLNLEFEGNALYLHKEDYTHGISKNSLWVNLNDNISKEAHKYNKNYVLIVATFDANDTGHMGAFGGGLKNLTSVSVTTSN